METQVEDGENKKVTVNPGLVIDAFNPGLRRQRQELKASLFSIASSGSVSSTHINPSSKQHEGEIRKSEEEQHMHKPEYSSQTPGHD